MPARKGQASIEYMMLLAVMLFFFSLLVPLMLEVYEIAFYSANVTAAKEFSSELYLRVEELSFMGNGSFLKVEARPAGEWIIEARGKSLFVVVKNSFLKAEKVFEVPFPNIPGSGAIKVSERVILLLRKRDGLVLLEYPDNDGVFLK